MDDKFNQWCFDKFGVKDLDNYQSLDIMLFKHLYDSHVREVALADEIAELKAQIAALENKR